MKRMGITNKRAGVGAAAVLLLLAATSDGDAQSTSTSFGPPAAYVRANATIDYDVPTNADPNSPRHAFAEVTKGRGKAKVDAVATLNGQRGFGTLTSVRSFSPADLCGGDAAAAMFFVAYDPMNRDSVKVQIEYQAVADTGFPILESPGNPVELASASFFDLRVGRLGNYGWVERDQYDRATVYMPTVGGPVAPVLEVSGLHIRNSGDPFPGFNELVIRSQGQELQRTRGSGPLEYGQQFTVDVPTSNAMLMTIAAYAYTNGVAYLDPIVTPHPDNPEVVVTVYGVEDPDPSPVTLDRAELLEVGIDPGPLEAIGVVDPDPEASPDPSPTPSPVPSPAPSSVPSTGPSIAPSPSRSTDPSPSATPQAIAFVAPLPDATVKPGRTVRTRFLVVDDEGAPIADAVAKALVKRCAIKAGVDAATKCARYDKRKDLFLTSVTVPKDASLGAHAVVAECRDAKGAVTAEGATPIAVVPRGRRR